jgi:hypothetical protein
MYGAGNPKPENSKPAQIKQFMILNGKSLAGNRKPANPHKDSLLHFFGPKIILTTTRQK